MNNTQLELLDGYLDNAFDTIYEDNHIDERRFKIDRLKKLMTIYDTSHYDYQLYGVKPDVKNSFKVLHNLYHNSLLSYDNSFIRRNVRALDHYFKGTGDINKIRLQQEMAKKIHEFITELESGWRLDLIAYLGRNEALQQNKIYLARQDKLIKYKLLNKNGQLITGSIIDKYSNFAMPNANKDWEDSEFRAIRKTIKEPILKAILPKSSVEVAEEHNLLEFFSKSVLFISLWVAVILMTMKMLNKPKSTKPKPKMTMKMLTEPESKSKSTKSKIKPNKLKPNGPI